jgi:integrase
LDAAIADLSRKEAGEGAQVREIEPWRIHDLRRTFATGMQRLGVRFEVTEAVLNHVSGARSGVAGIYQRHDWREEKRVALDAWARHLETLIAGTKPTNVVALHA